MNINTICYLFDDSGLLGQSGSQGVTCEKSIDTVWGSSKIMTYMYMLWLIHRASVLIENVKPRVREKHLHAS